MKLPFWDDEFKFVAEEHFEFYSQSFLKKSHEEESIVE